MIGAVLVVTATLATAEEPVLVDVTELEPRLLLDIRYATADNFAGRRLYPVARCLLVPEVARRLQQAQQFLDASHPGYVLLLKDCYRPLHVQRALWDAVKDTPERAYVADPDGRTGSVHTYGAAVDVTLADAAGREVDMGTPYDHLGVLAEPRHEDRFVSEGKLSAEHVRHRRILREAMVRGGGFRSIRREWWHFDAWQGEELRRRYRPLDLPLDRSAPSAGAALDPPLKRSMAPPGERRDASPGGADALSPTHP